MARRRDVEAREVAVLVAELSLPASAILIEHNGTALRREEWAGRHWLKAIVSRFLRIGAGG